MSERQIKAGIIGYGGAFNMGRHHGNSMQKTGRMVVRAICDLDPSRTAQAKEDFPGIDVYDDVERMLAEGDIDLVVMITPHNTHADLAVQCLKAGKHAIVEKPMCITVQQADEMIAAAEANDVMISVFHNRRWDGDYVVLRDIISRGLIGDIFHVEMAGGGYGHPGTWWRSNKEISGGAFYDWGAHYIDWLLNLVDSPVRQVTGFVQKRVWMDVTNEDHVHSVIAFEDGTVADVTMSHLDRAPKPRWRILGTKGAVVSQKDHFEVHTDFDGVDATMRLKYKDGDWDAYYRNIAGHLLDGEPLAVTPESGRRVISVIESTGVSAERGEPVEVPYK